MTESLLLDVRYKLKGDKAPITVSITEKQYVNLLELPVIETCEIIGQTKKEIPSQTIEKFNQRIKTACRENEISHTKYLIQ